MTDLNCWIIIESMKPESIFNFTFKACLPFIDRVFVTLSDYPASKISHVIIYKLSLATK